MKKILGTVLSVCVVLTLAALSVLSGGDPLTELQLSTLKILLIVCGASAAYCFIVGEITHNHSQMDKLWSLLPIAYLWIMAARDGLRLRLLVCALLVTAWGIRLTVNFARKGAYRLRFWEGNEDYRWSIVRQHPVFRRPILWSLFNLFFISLYQNLLVLSITLPALVCMGSDKPFGPFDAAAAVLSLAFLILETVSDEYQWRFHEKKKALLKDGGTLADLPAPYGLGFNTTGPWGYMRHPNYLGEQGLWISLYLFAAGAGAAKRGILHPTLAGPLFLILLFMGSSTLGEAISSGKYPRYRDYMAQIPKYLPLRKFRP